MSVLKRFIHEELTYNYWLKRPIDSMPDVADSIADTRADVFASVSDDFEELVTKLRHDIETARDIGSMEDVLERAGFDAYDIVADVTLFDRAAEIDDIETVRREILKGVEREAGERLRGAEDDGHDTSTLLGHPMRSVKAGGFSHKRAIGP